MKSQLGAPSRVIVETDKGVLIDMEVWGWFEALHGDIAQRLGVPCNCASPPTEGDKSPACPAAGLRFALQHTFAAMFEKSIAATIAAKKAKVIDGEGPGYSRCLMRLREARRILDTCGDSVTGDRLALLKAALQTPELSEA